MTHQPVRLPSEQTRCPCGAVVNVAPCEGCGRPLTIGGSVFGVCARPDCDGQVHVSRNPVRVGAEAVGGALPDATQKGNDHSQFRDVFLIDAARALLRWVHPAPPARELPDALAWIEELDRRADALNAALQGHQ